VNELKLSGTIESDVETAQRENVTIRSAMLRFDTRGGDIRIVAPGAAGAELAQFSKGDGVVVTGRLLVHFETKRLAVFADRVASWKVGVRLRDSLWMNRGGLVSDAPKEDT
jgi:hypothetical protein